MSPLQRAKLWFGAYPPAHLAEEAPEDLEPITKLGATVLFAATVAALNWGISGWIFGAGAPAEFRPAIILALALLGAALVLVFDRSFIYFADTAEPGAGRLARGLIALFRVLAVLAVGSFSAQAVMPLVLDSELRVHALEMLESSEQARAAELGQRFGLAAKEAGVRSAEAEAEEARRAAALLPADISRQLRQVQSCWVEYRQRRVALPKAGQGQAEARARLAAKAAQCAQASRAAEAARAAYLERARTQLDHALERRSAAEAERSEAATAIRAKLERARLAEESGLNARNSDVLWHLIRNQPGALMKWAAFNAVILLCELFPLLQKWQSGPSNIGRRRAARRALARLETAERVRDREHEAVLADALHAVAARAAGDVLNDPAIRAEFARAFAAYVPAQAPLEAVRAMLRDIEARHLDVQDFMRRHPRHAPLVAEAWAKAVRDATELLARGWDAQPTSTQG